jgi:hypothetical protein
MESAKTAISIVQDARSPVMAWSQRHTDTAYAQRLPRRQFVHKFEPKIVNKTAYAVGYNDRLQSGDFSQRTPIQMIKMSMCYQDKVDLWQVMKLHAGPLHSLYQL